MVLRGSSAWELGAVTLTSLCFQFPWGHRSRCWTSASRTTWAGAAGPRVRGPAVPYGNTLTLS